MIKVCSSIVLLVFLLLQSFEGVIVSHFSNSQTIMMEGSKKMTNGRSSMFICAPNKKSLIFNNFQLDLNSIFENTSEKEEYENDEVEKNLILFNPKLYQLFLSSTGSIYQILKNNTKWISPYVWRPPQNFLI